MLSVKIGIGDFPEAPGMGFSENWAILPLYAVIIFAILYSRFSAFRLKAKVVPLSLVCAFLHQFPNLSPFLTPLPLIIASVDGVWSATLVALIGSLSGVITGKTPWFNAGSEVLFGCLMGFLMTLDYSDPLPRLLRKPVVASALVSLLAWPSPLAFALASVPELYVSGKLILLVKFFLPAVAAIVEALFFQLSPFYKPLPISSDKVSPLAKSTALAFGAWLLALYLMVSLASITLVTFVKTNEELKVAQKNLEQNLFGLSSSLKVAETLANYLASLPDLDRTEAIKRICLSSCLVIKEGSFPSNLSQEEEEALNNSWPLSRPFPNDGGWAFSVIRSSDHDSAKILIRVPVGTPNICLKEKELGLLLCSAGIPESFEDKLVRSNEEALAFTSYREIVSRVSRSMASFALAHLLILLLIMIFASILTSRFVRPLEELSRRAIRLTSGDLDESLHLAREDEIGKLARVLERMRLYLKQRLDESYTLLRVSQKALSIPELEKGIEVLLSGLRELTKAAGVALIILDKNGLVDSCIAQGRVWREEKGRPPSACSRLLIVQNNPVIIPFVREAPPVLREVLQEVGARSAIGIPLQNGVLWFTFSHPLHISSMELNLINTVAGQLAVMAENIKLFNGLERQKAYLEAILKSTLDPILVIDELGRLVTMNPAAEEALWIKGEIVRGLPLAEKLRDLPWKEFLEQLKGSKTPIQAEIPSRQGVTFHAKAYPLTEGGNFRGWVIALRDITPLKEEERLRTESLEIVFHDLHTPLTLIRDYAKTLKELGELNEKQLEIVEKLLRNVEHLSRLVRNFLDISRMEAGMVKLSPCWLGPLVEEAVTEVAERAEEKGLSIEVNLEEAYPFTGDREFVKRAIVNLLDNAIKYTPAPGKITVSVDEAGNFWVLRVQDTGIGIPYSEQPRIFEKFYRGKDAESMGIRGSGLGLALVKTVAEKHRGKVWVESHPGKGSTFFLAIPKAQRAKLPEES